jgi:hypothetical protein
LADSKPWQTYIKTREQPIRMVQLEKNEVRFPLDLTEDLLMLDISLPERQGILARTDNDENLRFENMLTQNLLGWDQDLAATAINLWQERSEHTLWFRLLSLSKAPMVPQRVSYCIMLNAFSTGGSLLLSDIHKREGFEELSEAFYGLWLLRLLQWNIDISEAKDMAKSIVKNSEYQTHPSNKALVSAIQYLARFDIDFLKKVKFENETPWADMIKTVLQHSKSFNNKSLLKKLNSEKIDLKNFISNDYPPVWLRNKLPAEAIGTLFKLLLNEPNNNFDWTLFAGISSDVFNEALKSLDEEPAANALHFCYGLMSIKHLDGISDKIKENSASPTAVQGIPGASTFRKELEAERKEIISGNIVPLCNLETDASHITDTNRRAFFDTAYRGKKSSIPEGDSYWHHLTDCFQAPKKEKIQSLATAARKIEGVFRICYINTLAQFKKQDDAVLKLLDFVRSEQTDELRAVTKAFFQIGTPRADQELVSTLTRPNISPSLRLGVCADLSNHNIENLQKELRAAHSDILNNGDESDSHNELVEAVADLLATSDTQNIETQSNVAMPLGGSTDAQLDDLLQKQISDYKKLSSEVKRALRTAQFFHLQVTAENAPESIDLSPVIDMQYKALELLFRELFENVCTKLIHNGVLQRKLDVIGYARPIVRQMDDFENYIAALDTIKDIPFFSKFKMRKMLRAICQFRPGRRFTLDGLKAFAIFFLCFGRDECRHGLNGILKMGLGGDKNLFDFCTLLHTLQDARNRAAHEGFHPDASNDIDGIWDSTSLIIATAFKLMSTMTQGAQEEYAPKNRSNPVVTKKVS